MMAEAPEDLPLGKQISYAVGQFGWSTLTNLIGNQLLFFYLPPKDAGIPPFITQTTFLVVFNAIAILAASGRLFDAITDPLIASLSDRSKNPKGRRIPFMRFGAVPAAFFCVLMFIPPVAGVSIWNIAWLFAMQILFFLSLTIYLTPYFALLPELGHTATQRLNLSTYISVTWALGLILAFQTPLIASIVEEALGVTTVASFQLAIAGMAVVAAALMLVPVVAIDERRYCRAEASSIPVLAALRKTFSNRNFVYYVAADFSYFTAIVIIQSSLLFVATVLLLPGDAAAAAGLFARLGVTMVVVSFVLYPIVNLLARLTGKKILIMLAFIWFGAVFMLITVMGKLPFAPDLQGYALAVLAAVPMAFLGILPNAALADIAEHDGVTTGERQEGMFFAARTFLQKIGQTAGLFAFAMLATFGRDPGNDLGIRLAGPVGTALCLAAVVVFSGYGEKQLLAELEGGAKPKGRPPAD